MAKTSNSEKQGGLYRQTVQRMPEGYYSGDRPNPNLRAFVEAHLRENPYDPETDDYDVPAFDRPIETTKATAIYNMHTYWSKKPHDAIRQYVRHYTEEGDLVVDPFCGSGGTALAALMEGRKAVAIDRSPAATFITKNYCTPVDVEELKGAFEELKAKVQPEIEWLYETRCDRCDGKATVDFTLYSQVFQCPRCMERVALFDCVEVDGQTAKGKPKKMRVCPHCHKRGQTEEISTREERMGQIPVMVNYTCGNECKAVRCVRRHNDADERKREYFEKYDLGKLGEIETREVPHWYPRHKMMNVEDDSKPWGAEWREGRNFRSVDALFTKRNLWALAAYYSAADQFSSEMGDVIKFGLNSIILAMSRMQGYVEDPRFPNQLMRGTYYLPQTSREYPVHEWLDGKLKNLIAGYRKIAEAASGQSVVISTQSAIDMNNVMPASVDYIFTDPPYSGTQQYGELNFVWEAWLNFDTHWQDEEIIVNEVRGKTESDWADMMRQAMAECYRILKPGRWLSLCYHDTSEGTWALIQDIMAEVGFLVDKSDTALFISAKQKSYNQLNADKVNKRDLVINFRKPRPGEVAASVTITGEEDATTFNEKVRPIIRDYLTANPGETKDRIYDEVVSRMVRAGRMEAHDFDELLAQVAEEVREPLSSRTFAGSGQSASAAREASRWYLKETEMTVVDSAESAKEDSAAASIKSFITQNLAKHRAAQGVHYSDIFEHFVYTVKDKPRRPLAEWLLDYFYKTDEGTYRLPASEEEEELKRQGRASGTNRRIKRYIAYLQQGVALPERERPNDATLAEWIRSAKRSGMYEAGKLLYEKGGLNLDNLPEGMMVKVEEDYQVCVRLLVRASDQPRITRKTVKKGK
jgi:DNA modification methylase